MATFSLNEKAVNLIRFLKDLSQLRQKPAYSYKNFKDIVWLHEMPKGTACKNAFTHDIDAWLLVQKPTFPPFPTVPKQLEAWLNIQPQKRKLTINESITYDKDKNINDIHKEVQLVEHPKIQKQINDFIHHNWEPFVHKYERANEMQQLYDQLFNMYQQLQNQSEPLEAIVCIGFLQWKEGRQRKTERHLLKSEVALTFDRESGEIRIVPATKEFQFSFEEDMLHVENRFSYTEQREIETFLATASQVNHFRERLPVLLKRMSNMLDSRSSFSETLKVPPLLTSGPLISLSPAFIVREKSRRSYQNACEQVIQQLNRIKESEIPPNLANLFLNNPTELMKNHSASATNKLKNNTRYFPLPSNEEQNKIAEVLHSKRAVLVKGPPGTGKTHTIANLTAHFLATGKRVLITSQTAKALRVVKDKLPKQLQHLTVHLLGGDAESMKELEGIVQAISAKHEQFNESEVTATLEEKEKQLQHLREKATQIKATLLEMRQIESETQHFHPPYEGTMKQITQQIRKDEQKFHWYTTEIPPSSDNFAWKLEKKRVLRYLELKNVYSERFPEWESHHFPVIDPTVHFNYLPKVIAEETMLKKKVEDLRKKIDGNLLDYIQTLSKEKMLQLKERLFEYDELTKPLLCHTYPTIKRAMTDMFQQKANRWMRKTEQLTSHIQTIERTKKHFDRNLVSVPKIGESSLKKAAKDIYLHVKSGGRLGNRFIKPKVIRPYMDLLPKIKYNGLPIRTKEDAKKIYAYAQAKHAYRQINELNIPELQGLEFATDRALMEYKQFINQLQSVLKISHWRNNLLQQFSYFTANHYHERMHLSVVRAVHFYENKRALLQKEREITEAITALDALKTKHVHPLYKELRTALQNRDTMQLAKLKKKFHYVQKIKERREILTLLAKELKKTTPDLVKKLDETHTAPVWNERLRMWEQAFHWKRAKQWLEKCSSEKEEELSARYEETKQKIRNSITEVGALKAWIHTLRSMSGEQSKHLKAWAQAVKNVGKGTGKNAARHIANAQKHMEKCKSAIPAWIMPLHRVFENFDMQPRLFDVVIVDEASQSWHEALLLYYLADQLIIVGDDRQISPSIIGIESADIEKLTHKYLASADFPFTDVLNANNSFFDVSYIMFQKTITLREHFRCMPEIIGFSNEIAYTNERLLPLRPYSEGRLKPLEAIYVPHGERKGSSSQSAINKAEAEAIVKQIQACLSDSRYDGKTFGVISLLGGQQAKFIQDQLLQRVGAKIMEEREMICGDAYAFQGDERDIIFLSMVAAKGGKRIAPLTSNSARQRFNVAVSRAKDQLWLVHSLSIDDIKNKDCLRYQLLAYVGEQREMLTTTGRMTLTDGLEENSTSFQREIYHTIVKQGYRITWQNKIADIAVDFIIHGEQAIMAIMCDEGSQHPQTRGNYKQEWERERVLKRAGWTFWRIRARRFYMNEEKEMKRLWRRLDELNIYPEEKKRTGGFLIDSDITVKRC